MPLSLLKNGTFRSGKPRTGFTLVELAIVLIIIGTISYLLFPAIIDLTKKEKQSVGKSEVEALRREVMGHILTQNGSLPPATDYAGMADPWGNAFGYGSGLAALVCGTTNSTTMKITLEDGVNQVLDVAFFVSSNGPNQLKQVGDSNLADIRVYSPSEVVGGKKYDDIVEYVTLYQLAAMLCRNSGPGL